MIVDAITPGIHVGSNARLVENLAWSPCGNARKNVGVLAYQEIVGVRGSIGLGEL
jgi:hypothetical protein